MAGISNVPKVNVVDDLQPHRTAKIAFLVEVDNQFADSG